MSLEKVGLLSYIVNTQEGLHALGVETESLPSSILLHHGQAIVTTLPDFHG